MKLSKSKQFLADAIHKSDSGWLCEADVAVQDRDSYICFYDGKPIRDGDFWINGSGGASCAGDFQAESLSKNWHQCVLSREEYYQAYPKADADGWIEWNGGECPVSGDDIVDVTYSTNGSKSFSTAANRLRWSKRGLGGDIIAYRLHKPEVKPEAKTEFCESVMRSIAEPEVGDAKSRLDGALAIVKAAAPHLLSDKYKFYGDEIMGERKPSIEQLARDYRNKMDYANSKQQEADDAMVAADVALGKLDRAGDEIGLLIGIHKDGSVVDYLGWNSWVTGDLVELVNRQGGMAKVGEIGPISKVVGGGDFYVDFPSQSGYSVEHSDVKFIRRP